MYDDDFDDGLRQLPQYSRSLLKIQVPVAVTLASTKQPIARIADLAPGAIIQFSKTCEETLNLEVGNQPIGEGEAVKVGDKFGLRLTSMTMPDERFNSVGNQRALDEAGSDDV